MHLLITFFILLTFPAWTENATFKIPVYGGSGCPKNKAVAILNPDGFALSIIFSDYIVTAGKNYGRSFTQKNCEIAIPIQIPPRKRIQIIGADYRGFNDLPCGTKSTLKISYQFANSSSANYIKNFAGPIRTENYLVRNKLNSFTSICGSNTTLYIKSLINVQANLENKDATSAIDSLDIALEPSEQNGITLYFKWVAC